MEQGNNNVFFIGLIVMVVVMGAVAYTDTYYNGGSGFIEKSSEKSTQCIDVREGLSCPTGYATCQAQPTKCCTDAAYCPK